MDFAERADLTGRLHGLVILLDDRVTLDQTRLADEHIDAGEFGVALETLADWLSENATPIPNDVRSDFEMLASKMGNVNRVMQSLAACPVAEPDAPDASDSGFPF
jgi:hypothetical protein